MFWKDQAMILLDTQNDRGVDQMKIGITYNSHIDYKAQGFTEKEALSLSPMETVDAVHSALIQLGHESIKIGNFLALIELLLKGEKWDLIFNLADGTYVIGREALIPSVLDEYQIPYVFSTPLALLICLDKSIAKRIVRDHGISTASFSIIHNESDAHAMQLHYPIFVKPLHGGRSFGISDESYIVDPASLINKCLYLIEKYKQPVLAESYLPGREFTVGILGTGDQSRVFGVMEVLPTEKAEPHCYSRKNKEFSHERMNYIIVEDEESEKAEQLALAAWRALMCKDAGRIDIRSDEHQNPHFLEANPIPGLNPQHSDLTRIAYFKNMSYQDLISEIIKDYIH